VQPDCIFDLQDDLLRLEQYKADLSNLNLSVSNLLAQLVGGPQLEAEPVSLAQTLEQELMGLYNLWERSFHSTSTQVTASERTTRFVKKNAKLAHFRLAGSNQYLLP
jgi:hypothetical protein